MTRNDLETLFDYGYWANGKLFPTISELTPEQYTQAPAGGHGAVRDTMVHIMSAEWGWIGRCGGPPRGAPLNPADYPTLASLTEAWTRVEAYVRTFLSSLRDEDLKRSIEFGFSETQKRALPLGNLLHHAANHGVHHRGQVSLRLRWLGYHPAEFDLLFYFAEKQEGARS